MWWFTIGTSYLPVALVIWSCAAFAISFIIAVLTRHVEPLVPFISDTGTLPPERCIFGLMINLSAFLGLVVMCTRYKLLKTLNDRETTISPKLNCAALVCGALGCLGMCIVANFQETTLRVVHDFGALLSFIMGTTYLVLQTWISFKMRPYYHTQLGYGYHVTSAVCEWLVAFTFNFFFLTYIRDFQAFTIKVKTVLLQDSQDESYNTL
ncbi:DNA damage-regulated autophagy modulator protein 1 isoform X2 [Heterodontus francisci]|uniref:DNA damage-regulated autophagy modulator protein 1 isoform X2 n=1 Tax=Heterodontus francisci TaxID=7792 RepID=UPI00355C4230